MEVALPDVRSYLVDGTTEGQAVAWALDALELGMLHTRAAHGDLERASLLLMRASGESSYPEHAELWHNKRTIMFQEAATFAWLEGHYRKALHLQTWAAGSYALSRRQEISRRRPSLFGRIRELTLRHKYAQVPLPYVISAATINAAIEHTHRGDTAPLRFLADIAVIYQEIPGELIETVVSLIEREIQRSGYGQDFDLAAGVLLRRRWWCLRARLGIEPSASELEHDIAMWKQWQLFNELRETAAALNRFVPISGGARAIRSAIDTRDFIVSESFYD
jgi:hypothetical protein